MKTILIFLFCLFSLAVFAGDRTSYVYTGLGTALVSTYDSDDSTNTTSSMLCQAYDRLNIYITIDSVGGSGAAIGVYTDYSPDGTNFYPLSERVGNTDSTTTYNYELDAIGSYCLPFLNIGKYFRVRIVKLSGTSTAVRVTACFIEAKS